MWKSFSFHFIQKRTYRVVLHPSYLRKVFSFIRYIKDRYSFKFLSETSQTPKKKKKKSETYRNPEGVYLAQKYSIIQIVFFYFIFYFGHV